MKNKILLIITSLIFLCIFVGCINNEFDSKYKQFKDLYVLATGFVEKDNDSLKALKKMDTTAVEAELKKMKKIMDAMSTESNSKDEKGIYGNVKMYYQGIEFLLYAAKNFEKLTTDEKLKVDREVTLAIMHRKSISRGDV